MDKEEYLKSIKDNEEVCDALKDGDLSVVTCIDKLEELGYRIVKSTLAPVSERSGQFTLKQLWIIAQKYNQGDFCKMVKEIRELKG
jgi:hypothetical protein